MPDAVRVAIIGSGPAGLSAAAHAAQLGLSHVLIEKTGHLSDTIYRYQRGKHVMATPSQLVLRADLAFDAGKREAVLDRWDADARALGVKLRLSTEVKKISGSAGDFTLTLASGATLRAETVVLAIGTQGNPNLLALRRRRLAKRPVQPRRPGGICRRAYRRDRRRRRGDRERARTRRRSGAAQHRVAAQPLGRFRARQGSERQGADRRTGRGAAGDPARSVARQHRSRNDDRRDARRRHAPALRPCHRAHGLGAAAQVRRGYRRRLHQRRPRGLSGAVADVRIERARPVCHRRAGRVSADQALHQPGSRRRRIYRGQHRAEARRRAEILEAKFAKLPPGRSVDEWLELFRSRVEILFGLSPLQMRELLLESAVRACRPGEVVFQRNAPGSSLFGIAEGSVAVEVSETDPSIVVPLNTGARSSARSG